MTKYPDTCILINDPLTFRCQDLNMSRTFPCSSSLGKISWLREEPVVEGIHAGLECGLFASKLEGLDAVSIGPQMHHIHTTEERLSLSSTLRTWNLIVRTLELLK